jgi:HEAT repeat protein
VRKRAKTTLAFLFVALASVAVWQGLREREPVFQGKSLRAWVRDFDDPNTLVWNGKASEKHVRAAEAIRRMGTSAVPFLVEMARAKDSRLERLVQTVALNQRLIRARLWTDKERHAWAVFGFQALGPVGVDAVPALVGLLHDKDLYVQMTAADCLGNIGPAADAAIPVLLQFLNDTNRIIAGKMAGTLGRIHTRPALVVPVLREKLAAPNTMFWRGIVMQALSSYGGNAKEAISSLEPFLKDADRFVRSAATNAIKAVEADAAAKAGLK